MNKRITACFVLSMITLSALSQEVEGYLTFNAEKAKRHEAERQWADNHRGEGDTLTLPFFDDFSRYSLPTNNPDIPEEWQRWCDNAAYINCTFPVEPPTVGVATLDGLDATGYPYQFFPEDAWGWADTLTSLPIDLSSHVPGDSLYLTFFIQPEGIGNAPEIEDKIYLEYTPSGAEDDWYLMWESEGADVHEFEQVFESLIDTILGETFFFTDHFQFRFRNQATLSGNTDHWHIDYVLLDANNEPDNFEVVELAFMECENTILNSFTSMPWTHFIESPASHMLPDSQLVRQRNMGPTINFTTGMRVEYEDQFWDLENDFSNTFGNGFSTIDTKVPINVTPNNFVFDTDVNDTCAVFDVKFYHSLSDATQQNDTILYHQVFQNYYAYDDGTAERAYAINEPGGKVAVKYQVAEPDSLIGLFMHFTPFVENQNGENFLLRAWADNSGQPGDEMGEHFSFHTPHYYQSGHNTFGYYEYDEPMYVDGVVYVGWVQDSDAKLNIGNDKNTNSNTAKLFYQLGLGQPWQQSEITGSVMIRPVFQAGKTDVWNSIGELEQLEFMMYPNPATNMVSVYPTDLNSEYNLQVYSATGSLAMSLGGLYQEARIDISDLQHGMYIVHMTSQDGVVLGTNRFIKE